MCQPFLQPGAFLRQFCQTAVDLFQLILQGAQLLRLLLTGLGIELALFARIAGGRRCSIRRFLRLFLGFGAFWISAISY